MNLETIQNSLIGNMNSIWSNIASFAPRLASAVFLILLGYLVAKSIAKLVALTLNKIGLDNISERVGLMNILDSWKVSSSASTIISKICFYFIFLIFVISTADVLELRGLSSAVDNLVQYLPNIVGACFIFFAASAIAHFSREAVKKTSDGMNLEIGGTLGSLTYFGILLVGIILAVGQLKIQTDFLTQIIQIALITAGVAVALSLGIGSRDVSKNLISGVYLKDSLEPGAFVKVGAFEGKLISVKPVCFELMDKDGRIIILPNSKLLECEIVQNFKVPSYQKPENDFQQRI